MKFKKLVFCISLAGLLSGCNIYDIVGEDENTSESKITATSETEWEIDNSHEGEDYYYSSNLSSKISHKKLYDSQGLDCLSPDQHLNILVVPIEFSDYPFSDSTLTDLNNSLNGNGYADTGYWESVKSYYSKSSNGKVNLSYEIADTYKLGKTLGLFYTLASTQYTSFEDRDIYSFEEYVTMNLSSTVVDYYIGKGKSTSKFDTDNNGFIDGLIMVYSCHNTVDTNLFYKGKQIDPDGDLFWAFAYWNMLEEPNYENPRPLSYFWMSYDFLYDAVQSPKVDAHTLIHETGHLFGLDDYYGDYKAGGLSMMDLNIMDLDPYSKVALGWAGAYVVQDSCEINLGSINSEFKTIIVPTSNNNKPYFNGTAFDEYLLISLYTPDGLNELDSTTKYQTRPLGYTIPGIQIYHVDSRIIEEPYDSSYYTYVSKMRNDHSWYYVGASNTYKNSCVNENFSLLSLIDKSNKVLSKRQRGTNSSLFVTGDKFSFNSYKSQFVDNKFNNGKSFDFEITFNQVSSSGASISFRKV